MINVAELRIGNLVYNTETKMPVVVFGVSEQGFIITKNEFNEYENVSIEKVKSLILDQRNIEKMFSQSILQSRPEENNIFYFSGSTTTYFLVNDVDKGNFFIGMIDTNLPEGYRRITRPFIDIHKLQNAYFIIYNKELRRFNL